MAVSRLMPNIIRGVQLDFLSGSAVTQTQFLVIVAIHSYGRCSMSELAKNMKIQMPTATGIVNRLTEAGLVRRIAVPSDRRKVHIELSPKGEAFMGDFKKSMRRRWEEALGVLSAAELAAFHRVVHRLGNALEEKRGA